MAKRRIFHDNGLSLALLALALVSIVGHLLTGREVYREEKGLARDALSLSHYAVSGHFLSSLFENWESEFLQMATYVLATIALFQRGSGDSKDPDGEEETVDEDPRKHQNDEDAPWPVRKGGLALWLYSRSLSLALVALFLGSIGMHLVARRMVLTEERGTQPALLDVLGETEFWFQSFQNWQSEFLSILVLVLLTIFLRQKGSPESKPVHFPHSRTGKD